MEYLCFHQDDRQCDPLLILSEHLDLFRSGVMVFNTAVSGIFLQKKFCSCKVEQMQREVA